MSSKLSDPITNLPNPAVCDTLHHLGPPEQQTHNNWRQAKDSSTWQSGNGEIISFPRYPRAKIRSVHSVAGSSKYKNVQYVTKIHCTTVELCQCFCHREAKEKIELRKHYAIPSQTAYSSCIKLANRWC